MVVIKLITQPNVSENLSSSGRQRVQFGADMFSKQTEIIAPWVCVSNSLSGPSPDLLDGIQPRRIGWKGQHFDSFLLFDRVSDRLAVVVGPVVPGNIDFLGIRIP